MGGGGGYSGRDLSQSQERRAEKEAEAKRILEQERASKRNLFISFATDDIDEVNLLRGQARNENSPISFVDRSVREPINSERADYIKLRITERIRQSSMTAVYLSDATANSQWVDWEVKKSLELGKKVIAVHAGDNPPSKLPSSVVDNKIDVVPWKDLSKHLQTD